MVICQPHNKVYLHRKDEHCSKSGTDSLFIRQLLKFQCRGGDIKQISRSELRFSALKFTGKSFQIILFALSGCGNFADFPGNVIVKSVHCKGPLSSVVGLWLCSAMD